MACTKIRAYLLQETGLSAEEIHSRLAMAKLAAEAERAAAEQAAAAVQAARAQESAIYALPVHKQLSLAQARNATAPAAKGSTARLDANSSAAAVAAARKEKRRMQSMLMLFAFRRG